MLAAFIGIVLSLVLIISAKVTQFDKDKSFYPLILICIASFYIVSAVMVGHSVVREIGIACIFVIVAFYGAFKSLFVVGFAIALHGVYDVLHFLKFTETVAPTWWAPFCATVDFIVGAWVMYLSKKQALWVTPHAT
ncbi:hypothetical protein QTP81_13655 [Alteromonas sp. ASW11-36]|uniref:Uncharacterized protein n=1 Tax=Alteromonas arenosi TaxID=3055817 RepID=A0ABT7SZL8_9ALTE|nr:DUF6010 family protein [Alteromonas sp. ASW11-36]MDM7861641.1 hypothetical protein [Alteromonas sp. ASW11-36]